MTAKDNDVAKKAGRRKTFLSAMEDNPLLGALQEINDSFRTTHNHPGYEGQGFEAFACLVANLLATSIRVGEDWKKLVPFAATICERFEDEELMGLANQFVEYFQTQTKMRIRIFWLEWSGLAGTHLEGMTNCDVSVVLGKRNLIPGPNLFSFSATAHALSGSPHTVNDYADPAAYYSGSSL